MKVDINLIKPSPYQPRLVFDIDELKDEIERDGLLSDLVVRKQGKIYELIDGERRLRALKKLRRKTAPVRVIKLSDKTVRRSVYKVNKIREDYTVEEESRYFKKLKDEGMTPWEISKELGVDFHWISAHLNIFKFPKTTQKAMWTGQISVSHIVALESVIGRSIKEALTIINEIINRKLTLKETKKIVHKQKEKVEEMRIKAAKRVLPKIAPKVAKLTTAEDFEKAAKVLKQTARKRREKALTPEEKASREAEKKRKQEAMKKRDKEKKRLEALRIRKEAKKMAQRIRARERRRIEEEVKEKIEKTSIVELRKNLQNLTHKIKILQKEKASFIKNKSFLLEALNFDCPHCKNALVVYQEGNRYLVKRSMKVAIVPEKPTRASPSIPDISSPRRTN
ncbi:MAG: ParB/RepB/Spo0J family partition protein [Candidatus Bathyarchaeota archaeon]|nr:MAG: ParB/RepB/Spo0J family partition protein [Candidatus Bathyarchaeota archaeon]